MCMRSVKVEGTVVPVSRSKKHGDWSNSSTHSYSQHYMSVSGQLHALVILPPMKEASSILWKRGKVTPTPSLDDVHRKITSCHCTTIHWSYIIQPGPLVNQIFSLKEACSNKNMFVSLTYSDTAFVFQNKNMLYLSLWQNQLSVFYNTGMTLL
jgi:hypothetical protein